MFAVAKIYAIEQAEKLNKLTMIEFFNYIHSTYYPNQDISFMEYFLELTQYEGECVVEHTKLIEYGIMTSEQSSDIKKKIDLLGLELEVDYLLRHVSERLESGTKHSKLYTFTPEAFKKMLMRAQRRSNQRVDPVIYIDYYLLLEKVFKLYTDYERAYLNKLLSIKDEKIDKQSYKIDEQSNKIDTLIQETKSQSADIAKLLNYSNAITKQNVDLIERTDHLQITADMTQEDLDKSLIYQKEILNHLVDKSYKSTMNPANPDQVTHFAVLMPNKKNGRTILVRGQAKRINVVINKYYDTHKLIIDATYNANAINLVINAQKEYIDYRDSYIARYNVPIIQHNDKLKAEIANYNKEARKHNKVKGATQKELRVYIEEKKPLLRISDIPIKFGTTFITYKKNKHIRYKEVIQCIKDVNERTQMSPAASDDGSE